MGRKEEMFQYAREKLTPYISERANLLRKDCAAYLEMKREYHRIVSDLLQTAQKRQAAGTLGQIHYFSIFYLQSSAVTQSYDFALSLTNERYCLDQNRLLCFWCPQRLFQAVEEDLSFFEKDARQMWIRIRPYELEEIRRAYINNLYQLAGFFFGEESLDAAVLGGIARLDCCDEVRFSFGGYMDQTIQFALFRKGDEHEILSPENRPKV